MTSDLLKKLSDIKILIMDVDGVLTDCRLYYDTDLRWKRFYSVRDGVGIKRIQSMGYSTAVITGAKSIDVQARVKMLGIQYFYEDALDKQPSFENLLASCGMKPHQMAYIGDDIFDIPILEQVGFAATVPEAVDEVLTKVHYVTKRPGGNGAVREICDLIFQYGSLSRV